MSFGVWMSIIEHELLFSTLGPSRNRTSYVNLASVSCVLFVMLCSYKFSTIRRSVRLS
ncbi:hypothetical protein FKP32DRAFT_1643762 [Trametes sanguinea]|nr:hypothetical protein FKP32DRAFT_1643762 [Trametes sanguinea]